MRPLAARPAAPPGLRSFTCNAQWLSAKITSMRTPGHQDDFGRSVYGLRDLLEESIRHQKQFAVC